MIKEPKIIDSHTSGRQLSNDDFALISQWIATDKKKKSNKKITDLKKQQRNAVKSVKSK